MVLSTIDENLALFNNGNGDSVPATVPEREPHLDYDRRFILRLADGSKQKRSRPDHCYLTQASVMSPRWRL
jgi:hypothetical protein